LVVGYLGEPFTASFEYFHNDNLPQLVVFLLLIPLPLFFASTIFGERGFSAWVIIAMIWTFGAAFTVVLYPLWESRKELFLVAKGMIKVRDRFTDSL
jgi:hypothetical protein